MASQFTESGIRADPYSLSTVDQPPPFACSAAAFPSQSGPMLIRNFDFTLRSFAKLVGIPATLKRPMADPVVLMTIEPNVGRQTICMVNMYIFIGAFERQRSAKVTAL